MYIEHSSKWYKLDYCLWHNNKLIGILCGHQIENSPNHYSVEILGIHPLYQRKGIAIPFLKECQQLTGINSVFKFWTKCSNAKQFYLKHNFSLTSSLNQNLIKKEINHSNLILSDKEPHNIWEFTADQNILSKLSSNLNNDSF